MTGKEIVEQAIGEIARGLYRTREQEGVVAAADEAEAVLNFARSLWFDLFKAACADDPEYRKRKTGKD